MSEKRNNPARLADENDIVSVAEMPTRKGGRTGDESAKSKLVEIRSQPERVKEASRIEELSRSRGLRTED